MIIGAIVQARMNSGRFPGKVLHQVGAKPMLEYLLERLDRCTFLDTVVVATSTDQLDDPIERFCIERRRVCFRGSLLNVASRIRDVLDLYRFDAFVRVSGDSPLLDPKLVDRGVDIFLQDGFDLVTNVHPRSYPRGQSVEVLRTHAFHQAVELMQDNEDLEHVTPYFYRNAGRYRIFNFLAGRDYSGINLAVDTAEDVDRFAGIIARMGRPHWEYHLREILAIYGDISAAVEPLT